jgi:hypothetical protein
MDAFLSVDQQNVGFISTEEAKNFLRKPPFNFPDSKVCAIYNILVNPLFHAFDLKAQSLICELNIM